MNGDTPVDADSLFAKATYADGGWLPGSFGSPSEMMITRSVQPREALAGRRRAARDANARDSIG
jgi:hypothetical protein